ncbi:gephyrin-like molybdotransferase receptor GlpR [Streptomyces sp. L2]|uniref:divisome protein SepX/GlpR n=1 Tax=Streptomyces sp. L2 TaxID=2162665 RepID=UPI00101136A0|nr:gephyrin-like molybdotransferase receptor GlpR [Streptomyces sp. L2]
MSSSGLIYAVIVGAWAAYLVPMWLRRQDELNEARPTERFSTAIRLLSGRAGMERRYAKDLRTRSAQEGEPDSGEPGAVTDSVDVRAFAMRPTRRQVRADADLPPVRRQARADTDLPPVRRQARADTDLPPVRRQARADTDLPPVRRQARADTDLPPARRQARADTDPKGSARPEPAQDETGAPAPAAPQAPSVPAQQRGPTPRRAPSAQSAAARARRSKVLARRRRTTVLLFLGFTVGAVVAAVGGLAFLWAPGVPAALLSAYIVYLRSQERRRFAYQMDRRRAEVAAQRLRERQPRRRTAAAAAVEAELGADEPDEGPATETHHTGTGMSALAADRRALVEQTDHAEWVDQQRERQRRPGHGDSWDPVPVPLPTYVTAPVAPRATSDVDLGAPGTWSSARSSAVIPEQDAAAPPAAEQPAASAAEDRPADGLPHARTRPRGGASSASPAASARRSRERGRTPLFDQYEDGDRPRAANE